MRRKNSLAGAMLFFALGGLGSLLDQAVLAQDVKERSTLKGHEQEITGLAFTPSGKTLISSSGGKAKAGAIKIWDVATAQEKFALETQSPVLCVAVSPDGKTWTMGMGGNHALSLFDTVSGKLTARLEAASFFSPTWSLAFSPDGKALAAGNGASATVWDVASRKKRWGKRVAADQLGKVHGLAWSRDGKFLATANNLSREVMLWDSVTGKIRSIIDAHDQAVTAVAFSSDGKTLASGSEDKTVKLWSLPKGKEKVQVQSVLEGHKSAILSLAFSTDGKTLASGSADATVRLWSAPTGKELAVIDKEGANPRALAFSPGGKTLAVGWADNTIKLWDIEAIIKTKK